jgi:hypothetical protein
MGIFKNKKKLNWPEWAVFWTLLFNFFDFMWTSTYCKSAELEANPLLKLLIPDHMGLFFILKILIVPFLLFFLNVFKVESWARKGLYLVAVFYWLVVVLEAILLVNLF